MKKTLIVASLALLCSLALKAQTALKKVYDEKADPIEQIDKALLKAENEDKFVICQVGGNWCPWCLRFADFMTKDAAISKVVNENFVFTHTNYNPRNKADAVQTKRAEKLMKTISVSLMILLTAYFWMVLYLNTRFIRILKSDIRETSIRLVQLDFLLPIL